MLPNPFFIFIVNVDQPYSQKIKQFLVHKIYKMSRHPEINTDKYF